MEGLAAKLPPLKSLVAFEAVARHLSLTRAGVELRISREAVSRHIRVLEEHLGVKLFDRLHRAVALTPSGEKLQAVVQKSLEDIAYVSRAVTAPDETYKITVAATIAISSFVLTPRLTSFRAQHPNTEIHVVISDNPSDLLSSDIDVALRYGDGNWPAVNTIHLFDVKSFPMCTPEYLQKAPRLEEPSDLVNHTLVNLDGAAHAREDWWWWLNEHGVRVPESVNMLGFNSYDNVIQLALRGEGVALGYSGLVDEFLADGQFVKPLGDVENQIQSVYVVLSAAMSPLPHVQDFIDWIVAETKGNEKVAADG
ncbi:MAG: LysR substrate-binding domain-containing protein [Gammaproteobacteria bacterium]|nr:LysR substrate-binding domain-containing protein [Gammaproteobacteria bacterium]